jgi:formate-nitrite transporter family protein
LNSVKDTLRLWGVVLSANLIGTLAFAFTLATTAVVDASNLVALKSIALHALDGGYWNTLLRAIFAGWLIALMVWLLPVAEASRVVVIIIITYLVGIAGFPHIIAGSSEIFYALLTGIASPDVAIVEFFIPTLIGNTIGGVSLVAAINYAQVSPDKE